MGQSKVHAGSLLYLVGDQHCIVVPKYNSSFITATTSPRAATQQPTSAPAEAAAAPAAVAAAAAAVAARVKLG